MTREEAIEVYHGLLNQKIKEAFEVFAPELRESEDERIRKFLIGLLSSGTWRKEYPFSPVDCVAWLEKQKEIPMPNSTELIEMWDKEEAMLKKKDFRGDEWRLAYNAFLDGFARGTCVKSEKQKEQKPVEWSEFDRGALKDAICATDLLGNGESFKKSNPDLALAFRVAKDWLKSLPERFNLQPKQEWSIEDENRREGIIQWLREYQEKFNPEYDSLSIESIDSLINWLKSLHSKSHWKPSKEQMKALSKASRGHYIELIEYDELVELYNDLQKL